RPPRLLRLERGHLDRQLRRALHILQVLELPPHQLRPVAQIRIFRQGVMLPPPRSRDRLPPPHPRRPIKIEEHSSTAPSSMLQNKVPIQQNRLHLCPEAVVSVQLSPIRLHHPDLSLA